MRFDELNLPPAVMAGIQHAGFTHCTPIQEQVLPIALAGSDVAGQAQTGTGKTAAFLITLFTKLITCDKRGGEKDPRALILAPTRELVAQIEKDALVLGSGTGVSIQAIYGGVDYMLQRKALREGVDVVVGTPGRLIDYLKQGVYSLKHIEMLVIDEADRMFDMGFIADLRFILRRMSRYDRRQSLMFSATLNQRVMELAYEFMNLPVKVSVTPNQLTAERVHQELYLISWKEKFPLLLGLLRREEGYRAIIFVNMKRDAEWLEGALAANGVTCRVLSGDVEQRKRIRILEDFKAGHLPLLIATDVASRGLHIEGVTHVFNYDVPQDPEDYVHRIGRTARAGADGRAITLADEDGAFGLEAIYDYIGEKIPVVWPEDDWFVTDFVKPPLRERSRRGGSAPPSRGGIWPAKRKDPSPPSAEQSACGEGAESKGKRKRRRRPKRPGGAGQVGGEAPSSS